jgi:uncharacterized protein (DUF924 family)
MTQPPEVAGLLDFWFSKEARDRWFNSTPEFDETLRQRYMDTWRQGRDGRLQHWEQGPGGALALVILLDQFPLNMFRDQPESFSTEAQSRAVASRAIESGFDAALPDDRKAFLYLPFMHREIVRRFGRFPHRNAILGRTSSEEELAWLDSPEGFNP